MPRESGASSIRTHRRFIGTPGEYWIARPRLREGRPARAMTRSFLSPHNSGAGRLAAAAAARTVLARRHAMVIGPTPPGTGVTAPATAAASA
jgi:hypothetical protein